jgi:hypothetical protein
VIQRRRRREQRLFRHRNHSLLLRESRVEARFLHRNGVPFKSVARPDGHYDCQDDGVYMHFAGDTEHLPMAAEQANYRPRKGG